jgi:hypothetical protein
LATKRDGVVDFANMTCPFSVIFKLSGLDLFRWPVHFDYYFACSSIDVKFDPRWTKKIAARDVVPERRLECDQSF